MKPLIYLASPYSDPDPTVRFMRFDAACRFAGKLMREGQHVFSPIAHSHPVSVAGGLDGGFEFWSGWCIDMLRRCDSVVVLKLDGWLESRGVAHEIAVAQSEGKPIQYVEAAK